MAEIKREKRGLGRGLSALIGDVAISNQHLGNGQSDATESTERLVPIENIHPNPGQPRRFFDRDDLQELAASIQQKGILQPLIVRKNTANPAGYEIVAGERRWRAAQLANLHELPVLVREYSDNEVLEVAIIENVQRANLNPIEEAAGYRQLMDRFGHTQEKLAEGLSKSRSHIANLLRLLQLPEDVQEMLRAGKISAGHARALITSENPSELARHVVKNGLSVRETERLSKNPEKAKKQKVRHGSAKDADTIALEHDLAAGIGMKVLIDHDKGKEGGQITIRYKSLDDLDEICRVLSGS